MNNSNSQKPSDNTSLFANCAADWDSFELEAPCGLFDDIQDNSKAQELSSTEDSYMLSPMPIIDMPVLLEQDPSAYENNSLTRLYAALESAFTTYTPLSHAQSQNSAKELMLIPQKNYNWHLCLMGYHAQNIAEGLSSSSNDDMHDPLEGALPWIAQGMEKGWLRYVNMEDFVSPLHHAFLSQEVFWQRFVSACDSKKNRLSLVLFKIANTTNKNRELSELIEQILLATRPQDFFGEIKGLGVALVLPDYGCFAATACAERILSRMDKILDQTLMDNFVSTVSVAEADTDENADTIFAHAKESLINSNKNNLRVHVYRNTTKITERKSLVQSDEKRFLFFGVQ